MDFLKATATTNVPYKLGGRIAKKLFASHITLKGEGHFCCFPF